MWTREGSRACDDERHGDCDGVAIMIDQDGESRYRCGCWCHRERATNPRPEPPSTLHQYDGSISSEGPASA
jgi:hypothetical protein